MEVRPRVGIAFHRIHVAPSRAEGAYTRKSAATRNAVLPLWCALSSAHWADGPAGTPA